MNGIQLTDQQVKEVELREQDRWLPIANVARLMKNTLPPTAKVSKDAKECMQECVSEFISFITSEASDKCLNEKRKTINGEDILFAMTSLGFENYGEVLKIYLAKYREQQALKQERGENKKSRKQQLVQQQSESELPSSSSTQESPAASQTFELNEEEAHPQLDIPDDIMQTIKHEVGPDEELLTLQNNDHQQPNPIILTSTSQEQLLHSRHPTHSTTQTNGGEEEEQQQHSSLDQEDEIYKYTNDTY